MGGIHFQVRSAEPSSSVANVRTGATIPHGMVKVGMDTDSPGNASSVSASSTNISHIFGLARGIRR